MTAAAPQFNAIKQVIYDTWRGDTLHLDLETFSETDLRTRGLDNYSADPTCEALMLGWALNDEAPSLWFPASQPCPPRLLKALVDPSVLLKAWNAQFEMVIFRRIIEPMLHIVIPQERWRCSMVRAMLLSLPGKLEDCGKVLRLDGTHAKHSDGMRLIRLFCVPHEPTKAHPYRRYDEFTHPEDWALFCAYCLQDVVAERRIDFLLSKYPVPVREWEIYNLDQKINYRGVPIDVEFINAAIDLIDRRKDEVKREMRKLTGVSNPNSTEQLLPWLKDGGYPFSNCRKESIRKALEDFSDTMTPLCIRVLRLRQVAAQTSVTKYRAFLKRVGADGRLRFNFQMAGAGRTARWAGRGVQLQNLKKPPKYLEKHLAEVRQLILDRNYDDLMLFWGDVIQVLAASIRGCIAAQTGTLSICDLNAIETRLAGWISGCKKLNDIFDKGLCPYKMFASIMFGVPYDQVTPEMRSIAKPAVLGCCFMLSGGEEVGEYPEIEKTGLLGYMEQFGVKADRDIAHSMVKVYRETYTEIKELWSELKEAIIRAINTRQPQTVGVVTFDVQAPFLRMRLPSGRYIYYLRPQLREEVIKHAKGEFTTISISYEGKNKIGRWTRVNTHGGKVVENICQAIARDLLSEGMLLADADNCVIVGTVHDEIIAEGPECVGELEHCMSVVPSWAAGLKLAAKGFESKFYRKD